MNKITGRFIGILMVGLLLAILALQPETAHADRDCTLFDSDLASSSGYVLQTSEVGILRDAVECANRNGTDDIIDLNGFTFSFTRGHNHKYSGYTALELIKNSGSLRIRNGAIERDLSLASCTSDKDTTNFRLLAVDEKSTLYLDNVTLRNGCALDRSEGSELANLVTGGAIINYGKLYVNGGHFEGNEAQLGAAFANYNIAVIVNSSFVGNRASRVLTGFTADDNVSIIGHVIDNQDTTIINSTFSDNTVENPGAVVFFSDDEVNAQLLNVTIANNDARALGIEDRFVDGNFDFQNVVVANNTKENCSFYVRNERDNQHISATNSYSDDDKCDFAGNGGTDEATIHLSSLTQAPNGTYFHPLTGGDPVDGGSSGLLPTESSLEIDVNQDGRIESNTITVDQGGGTRVVGSAVDAGAFEGSCDHYNAFLTQTGYSLGSLNNDLETDLQDALECANDNDSDNVIDLAGQTVTITSAPAAYDSNGFNGLPEISSDGHLTIKNGTLQRDAALACTVGSGDSDAFRLLNIASISTVYLEDVVLENGCSDDGGAIYNEGDLRLNGVHFQSNSATAGAAIYNNGTLVGVNSSFSGNSGQRGSGANIVTQLGDYTTFVNSTFHNNSSEGDIFYVHTAGQLNLIHTTISENTATQVIRFTPSATAPHQLENSVITNNTAVNCEFGTPDSSFSAKGSYSDDDSCNFGSHQGVDNVSTLLGEVTVAPNGTIYQSLEGGRAVEGGNRDVVPTEQTLGIDVDRDGQIENKSISVDQRGADRLAGNKIDVGAYEISCDPYNEAYANGAYVLGTVASGLDTDLRLALECGQRSNTPVNLTLDMAGQTATLDYAPADFDHIYNGHISLTRIRGENIVTIKNGTIERDAALACDGGVNDRSEFRFLFVSGTATLHLENMTLRNGCANNSVKDIVNDARGGAIFSEGTLTLNAVHFEGNQASNGGAVYSDGAITAVNSSFTYNRTLDNGTGDGRAALSTGGDGAALIVNTTFSDNVSGTEIVHLGGTSVRVVNTTIAENSSDRGAIMFDTTVPIEMHNVVVANNGGRNCVAGLDSATASASGSYSTDNSCNFGDSGGSDNAAATFDAAQTAVNGTIYRPLRDGLAVNGGDNDLVPSETDLGLDVDQDGTIGGRVKYDQAGNNRISIGTVDAGAYESSCANYNNLLTSANGYVLGSQLSDLASDLRLAMSCANHRAGDTRIDLAGQTVTLTDTSATYESNGSNGLPPMSNSGTLTIINGVIERNSSAEFRFFYIDAEAGLALQNVTLRNGYTTADGGAIYNWGTLTLNQTIFDGNEATRGGALYNRQQDIGTGTPAGTVLIEQSLFSNNQASDGGAIYTLGSFTMRNSTLSGNSATAGGGLYQGGENSADLSFNTIADNRGGGLFIEVGGTIQLSNSVIGNNEGSDCIGVNSGTLTDGGYNLLEDTDSAACDLSDGQNNNIVGQNPQLAALGNNGGYSQSYLPLASSPIFNQIPAASCAVATDQRGAARPSDSACEMGAVEVSCSDLGYAFPYTVGTVNPNDHATDLKMAMQCASSETAVTITLSSDIVLTTVDNETNGSNGLPVISSELTLDGAGLTLERDRAYQSCDGSDPDFRFFTVANNGRFTLNNITLKNGCVSGADAAGRGGAIQNLGVLGVSNSTISNNTASDRAGAIFNGGELTLTATSLDGNSSSSWGGGLLNGNNGTVTIDSSTFSNNAANQGGGLFNNNVMTVRNSTISGNSGGGLYNAANDNVTINFSTIADNSGEGLYDNGGMVTLNASILANNGGGDCVHHGAFSGSHNLIQDGGSACGLGDGNLIGVNAELGGLAQNNPSTGSGQGTPTQAIAASSPAIDFIAADQCSLTVDQRGKERPFGNGCDIGAYEAQTGLVVSSLDDADDGNYDEGELTLREAIANAGLGATITFADSLSGGTIVLNQTLIIAQDVTISGNVPIMISGNDSVLIMAVTAGDVTLDNLALVNGRADGDAAGLHIHEGASVNLIDSTVAHHRATHGLVVGINNEGTMSIKGSTISDNVTEDRNVVGGIANTGMMAIENSTISSNSGEHIGGILNSGQLTLLHVTVAANTFGSGNTEIGGILNAGDLTLTNSLSADNEGADCSNSGNAALVTDGGHNLIEVDAVDNTCGLVAGNNGNLVGIDLQLEPLADNGGQTLTHALRAGSPALNGADSDACLAVDQRGVARPQEDGCDIGAVEMGNLGGTAVGGNLGLIAATGGTLLLGLAGLLVWRRREG
ncbi:MAG: choice-of-anchor Q domain-containing protein [Chloroflexota bacterium]